MFISTSRYYDDAPVNKVAYADANVKCSKRKKLDTLWWATFTHRENSENIKTNQNERDTNWFFADWRSSSMIR